MNNIHIESIPPNIVLYRARLFGFVKISKLFIKIIYKFSLTFFKKSPTCKFLSFDFVTQFNFKKNLFY